MSNTSFARPADMLREVADRLGLRETAPRPACQSEHRPEHWKYGQSPRATRLVVFRDGGRQYLCRRCVTYARRTISTDPRNQVDHTEAIR